MTKLLLAAIICSIPLAGCTTNDDDEKALQDLNVNAKYLVESVQVSGQKTSRISAALRKEFDKMVGSKLDYSALNRLAETTAGAVSRGQSGQERGLSKRR